MFTIFIVVPFARAQRRNYHFYYVITSFTSRSRRCDTAGIIYAPFTLCSAPRSKAQASAQFKEERMRAGVCVAHANTFSGGLL